MDGFDCSNYTLVSLLIAFVPIVLFFILQFLAFKIYHSQTSCKCETGQSHEVTSYHINGTYSYDVVNEKYTAIQSRIRDIEQKLYANGQIKNVNAFVYMRSTDESDRLIAQYSITDKIKYSDDEIESLKLEKERWEEQLKITKKKITINALRKEPRKNIVFVPVKCPHRIFYPFYWGCVILLITIALCSFNWATNCDADLMFGVPYWLLPIGFVIACLVTSCGAILWKFC